MLLACLLIFFALFLQPLYSQSPSADLILTNGRIWTVDPKLPQVEAIAILGERIVAVGSKEEVNAWKSAATKVIDLQGKRVVPGFNDSHVHFISGGRQLDNVNLKDADSLQEFARRIGERAKLRPKGEWILGGDWDDQRFTPVEMPTRQLIDPLTPDHPVFVNRYDGHMALANSLALKLAGVTKETPDPPGGTIVRDSNGEPTGALKDAAMTYVYKVIPAPTHEQLLEIGRRASKHAASFGVTSIQDMGMGYDEIAAMADLAERGELITRVYAAAPLSGWQDLAKVGLRHTFGSSLLRVGALKGFADGSLGSSTAYFFEPFSDDPKNHGLLSDEMQPLDGMKGRIQGADAAGLQVCVHAIGDQAISIILDLFDEVAKQNGQRDRRIRVEHAQHMAAKDFARFAKQDVIASMQPYHTIDDGRWAEKRIGHDRSTRTYAFRTFLANGARLAFGTDWNVAPIDPIQGLYAATTRATLDGKQPGGWIPEEKITLAETIEAYTMGSAFAEFQENEKGTIAPGKLADLVVLSDDIFAMKPEQIRNVKVEMTFLGGKMVYSK
ncbi:MAG TPA: amidohydrolase [Acidobacteriota bacterium]|nr:amidohydrolase [Acidobacteriota bacterium]